MANFSYYNTRSIAGWSFPSLGVDHETLPCEPPAPQPVEILKVSINSFLINWYPPEFDNGAAIDYYQIG